MTRACSGQDSSNRCGRRSRGSTSLIVASDFPRFPLPSMLATVKASLTPLTRALALFTVVALIGPVLLTAAGCGDINVNELDGATADVSAADSGDESCKSNADCDTGLSCLTGFCDGATSTCIAVAVADTCYIDGGCFASGEVSPASLCQVCEPSLTPTAFVAKQCPAGESCAVATGECSAGIGPTVCSADAECPSGLCTPTAMGESVCATPCTPGSCATPLTCKSVDVPGAAPPTATMLCVDAQVNACRPCVFDGDCQAEASSKDSVCAEIPGAVAGTGSFCLAPCSTGTDCAGETTCGDVNGTLRCVPTSGACGCSPYAVSRNAQGSCGAGECAGTQTCQGGQLTACDGTQPQTDVCDGLDNDCDGIADQDFIVDGQYATNEHCGACGSSCLDAIANGSASCQIPSGETAGCVLDVCDAGFSPNPAGTCTSDTAPAVVGFALRTPGPVRLTGTVNAAGDTIDATVGPGPSRSTVGAGGASYRVDFCFAPPLFPLP